MMQERLSCERRQRQHLKSIWRQHLKNTWRQHLKNTWRQQHTNPEAAEERSGKPVW